jgi:hypothetical protein
MIPSNPLRPFCFPLTVAWLALFALLGATGCGRTDLDFPHGTTATTEGDGGEDAGILDGSLDSSLGDTGVPGDGSAPLVAEGLRPDAPRRRDVRPRNDGL